MAQVEDARKAEILAAYKASVPLKEMIERFHVAEGYCSMVANDAGLTENRRNERIKIRQKPRNENIFREYESGVPVQKLSEKYQLSVPGIYKVIQRVRKQKEAMRLANRGMYVDDATTINCEYSLNEEVLSHYDPNFVKGL